MVILGYTNLMISAWIIILIGLGGILVYVDKKAMALPYHGGIVMLMVIALTGMRIEHRKSISPLDFQHQIESQVQYIQVKVVEEPKKGKRYRAICSVQSIGNELSEMKQCTGNILIYFPSNHPKPGINDIYLVNSKIQEVVNNTNPYTFDWKSYLFNRGILRQIFLKEGQVEKIGFDTSFSIMTYARKARAEFQNILSTYIKTDKELGIAYAMILGYRNKLDEDLYDAYTDTGAVHTLAVSGLHVGIMASILSLLLSAFPSRNGLMKLLKFLLLAGGIWFYVLITGAGPAIVRAAIMFTIIILDYHWSDNRNILNSLCAAGFFMVLFNPFIVYQAGFQFSFLALIGIIVFYRPINRLIPYIDNTLLRYLWGLICVSFAAQITVFPITVYYFHKFPSFFWLSGMIAVPLAFVILGLGVALIICNYILPILSHFIGEVLQATIELLNNLIVQIQSLPNSSNDHLWLDTPQLIMIYGLVALIGISLYSKVKFNYMYCTALIIGLFLHGTIKDVETQNQLELMVYDIYGGTVIDIIDGQELYTYKSIPREDQSEKFMCDNYRLSKSIKHQEYIDNQYDQLGDNVLIKNGYVLSKNKTILIAHESINYTPSRPVDYLILTASYKGKLSQLIHKVNPQYVVLDKSMSWDQYYDYKHYLSHIKQPVKNLFNTGALTIKL